MKLPACCLACLAIYSLTGCSVEDAQLALLNGLSKTVADETFELSQTEYKAYAVAADDPCVLTLKVSVQAGESVNVDLLDPEDFAAWKKSLSMGSYEYYRAFHGTSVLRNEFRVRLDKPGRYIVLIRPSKGILGDATRVAVNLKRFDMTSKGAA